ncbi:MAG: alpha/beta fold hydrolase [Geobacteraceae bacterium]|nr:alpha/beta fold hydrolase [Geobacteraceae bacterium]
MQLNYESRGSGHPLIILHGLFGSLDNWRTMSRKLSDRYRVITVDLRNHGGSPHSAEFSCALMAEDIMEFMHSHSIGSAHLLGHSMGGKVAMQLAVQQPEHVNKLVVVDIAPRAYLPAHEGIFRALSSIRLDRFTSRNEVRPEIEKGIGDRSVSEFLLKNLVMTETGKLQWKMNLAALRENYHEIISAPGWEGVFDKPAMFLRGGNSDYIRTEDHGVIKKHFPRAGIVTVPGAGHWVHAEAPDLFEKLVRDFLC